MKQILSALLCIVLLFSFAYAASMPKETTTPEETRKAASPAEPPAIQMETMEVTLFYRYQQTEFLACETRSIQIPPNESPEVAVIRQLLAGPQASHTELERLFPHTAALISVEINNDTLMVTMSEGLLSDGIPDDWSEDPMWREQAPLRRKLTMQSLVATLTENFSYPYVQIFLARDLGSNASTRLSNDYYLDGRTGPAAPLHRDESLLLTMQTTATTILNAWYRRDYDYLYQFTAGAQNNDPKPDYQQFCEELDLSAPLVSFQTGAGHTNVNNTKGVVTLDLTLMIDSREIQCTSIPLHLVRENAVWKVPYSELKRMMLYMQ